MLAAAVTRATSGEFTSLSGAAKSSSKSWLDLQQMLVELNLEIDIRAGYVKPIVVIQDLTGIDNPRFCGGFSVGGY